MKQFEKFRATTLYCNNCKAATTVREKLLLILPDGASYDYLCSRCGTSVGSRTEKNGIAVKGHSAKGRGA
ncbi:MAG: hypothetical protein HQL06_10790 [Nitrospirae bacterium]|nr:hypothetical protein [Nitrospirota bacterium]